MKKFICLCLGVLIFMPPAYSAEKLVVYSARKEQLIRHIFEAYTAETGTMVEYITDDAGPLLERLKVEGDKTQADILITVDAGNLWQAAEDGLFAVTNSEVLNKNIPAHLRDADNKWFGFSIRARTIAYSTERVDPYELSTYEDLGSQTWRGRLCLRTSKKVYNQSLVAMMIAEKGIPETERVVSSWVQNLAAEPFANDTAVLDAIASGQCDVGLVNTYYFGQMLQQKSEIPIALYWPNQTTTGVHVNISGAGVLKYSDNSAEAVKFLEWLSEAKAQRIFADSNLEYPSNPNVSANPLVAAWGEFKQNIVNVSEAGKLQQEAVMLMDRVGYK